MNNLKEMQSFLNDIKLLIDLNGSEVISTEIIYSYLMSYQSNISPNFNLKSLYFDEWVDKNKGKKNISVYIDDRYPNWCQFVNMKDPTKDEEIKLYIPLDIYHIGRGAQMIIDFLSENQIEHNSKIAKKIRNDDIVIRTETFDDAIKIINFVAQNRYLQEGFLKVNPFLINCAGVGVAMDGKNSYNFALCDLIKNFFNHQKGSQSLSDFQKFAEDQICSQKDSMIKNIYLQISKVASGQGTIDFLRENYERVKKGIFIGPQKIKGIDKQDILLNSSLQNLVKYGSNQLLFSLLNDDPNYKKFTRIGNARNSMIENITVSEIPDIIRQYFLQKKVDLEKDLSKEELIYKYVNDLETSIRPKK